MKYIVGLGNPDDKYAGTRHNIGREIAEKFVKKNKLGDFEYEKKSDALVLETVFEYIPEGKKTKKKQPVTFILPETYMNKSGISVKKYVSNKKKANDLTVIYDDLDLPLGKVKMNFNKGSGGHKGVESVIKSIGTKEFNRMRVGISKVTPGGKLKKPSGEDAVVKHVLGKFAPSEEKEVKKAIKRGVEGIELLLMTDRLRATNSFNKK